MDFSNNKLDRFSLWAIFVIVLVAFGVGIYQFRSNLNFINKKFVTPYTERMQKYREERAKEAELISPEDQDVEELKKADTDSDGLNDFEEYYVYGTSAYLVDSDSDGVGDKDEITQGNDPNCGLNEDCGAAVVEGDEGGGQIGVNANVNAAEEGGITEEMTTEGAAESFTDFLPEDLPTGTNTTGNTSSDFATQVEKLRQLPTEQKRQLLVESGFKTEMLQGIDDATLDQMFNDALNETLAGTGTTSQTSAAEANTNSTP